MDFDFSDDQEQLRDAVRRWVDKGYDFERRKQVVAGGGFDRAAYTELAELGVAGLYVPEAHGGMGMGPVEGMVVMEELGRGMVLEPVAQTLIASALLAGYAPEALQGEWLPRIAGGEAVVVLAHQERRNRYDPAQCDTSATEAGSGWTLTGQKCVVPVGDQADAWLVPARTAQGVALFLVDRAAAGAAACTEAYGLQDGGRAAELHLKDCPAALVTQNGTAAVQHGVDVGIAALCAEAVGLMDKTVATTAEYLNTRKQFGVAIASFQALRHRMADMKMQLELARSMSYYASLKLNEAPAERSLAMSRAKVQLGQSMRYVGQQAVQLHGGIAVTDEYIVSHYFKRLTQMEMLFGDTLHHTARVSEQMEETAGVFA